MDIHTIIMSILALVILITFIGTIIVNRKKRRAEELEAALKPIREEIAHQDELRKKELAAIELQVNNHLPTEIEGLKGEVKDLKGEVRYLGAKLDALIMHFIPKPKETGE